MEEVQTSIKTTSIIFTRETRSDTNKPKPQFEKVPETFNRSTIRTNTISYVLVILDIAYYMLLIPSRIVEKDSDSEPIYELRKPRLWRKVSCAVLCFLFLVNVFTDLRQALEENEDKPRAISIIYRLAFWTYFIYVIALLQIFWLKMNDVTEILNEAVSLMDDCGIKYVNPTFRDMGMNKMVIAITKFLIVGITFAEWGFLNTVPETNFCAWGQIFLQEKGIHGLFIQTGKFVVDMTRSVLDLPRSEFNASTPYDHRGYGSIFCLETMGFIYIFVDLASNFCWVCGNLFVCIIAIQFQKLFETVLKLEDNSQIQILKKVTVFIKVSCLIEKFNQFAESLILSFVINETSYISSQAASIIITSKGINVMQSLITTMVAATPFAVGILSSAQINYKAHKFASVLKSKFISRQDQRIESQAHYCANNGTIDKPEQDGESISAAEIRREIDRGLAIVYNDLSNDDIAFHGYFFSLTYGFVGTMVSGIFTYTVIALQLSSS